MGITVLGPVTVNGTDINGRRDRVVLAVLASRRGHTVPTDTVADALWGEEPPPSAAKNLQGCVVRLRRLLGPDAIATTTLGYSLEVPPDDVDAWRFERLVNRARELLALGEPDRASYQLGEALALWRGHPFLDLESWQPAGPEVRRLGELRLEAEELKAQGELAAGRVSEVLAACQTLVREAPLREQRWALLARAQYQAGQQAEALRTIQRLKAVLAQQLGIDPGRDMVALEQAVLQQDPSLAVPEQMGDVLAACPWQGLRAYDVDDADWFFGRERDVEACLEILHRQPMLALAGPSGSGKSSLLRAGVGSALRARGHRLVTITPGTRPMEALGVLHGTGPGTVLLVDQAEEVFTLCQDEEERRTFLDSLVDEAERRTVLVALRADRLAEVALHSAFSRMVERGLYLVGGLDEGGLHATIETPARQAGLLVEPGLVDLLVAEVARDPGALPLLSHALLETWQRREGRTLTAAGYRDSGGIQGAVAQSAEQLYAALDPVERPHLRDVMLRLVIPDEEGDPVRAKVPRRLLDRADGRDELVERLVQARLVTSDEGVVAISHEALARAWPRLRTWLDDDVDGQRILHHLAATADGWDALSRPGTELYRGVRLARAFAWQEQHGASLNPVETDFLAASREAEQVAERSAADHARRQTILIRRLRLVLGGAVVLLVLALVAGGFAAVQSDRAGRNAAEARAAAESARQAAVSADARRVGAKALATDDLDMAMLLAVAGVRLDDSPETRSSLLAVLGRHPELTASTQTTGAEVMHLDVSPDGGTVATYDRSNRIRLHALGTGKLVAEFQAGSARPLQWLSGQARFSPDGNTVAAVMAAPTRQPVRLLDATTLAPLDQQPGGLRAWRWQVLDLSYSPDGGRLAASLWRVEGRGDAKHTTSTWAVVWDLSSPGTPVARIRLTDGNPGVAFGPQGRLLYTTGPLTRHDLDAGGSVPVPDAEPTYERLAVSPDGRFLAAAVGGGLALLDAETGSLVRRLGGTGDFGFHVTFSGDGGRVATVTGNNQEGVVWEIDSGDVVARLPLGESGEWVGFSPDGSTAYTAGADAAVRHWDLDGRHRYVAKTAQVPLKGIGFVDSVQPAPGGRLVAYPAADRVTFLDVEKDTLIEALDRRPGHHPPWSGSWHPNGRDYALPTGRQVQVWNATTGERLRHARVSASILHWVDHGADGSRLAIVDQAGRVSLLDSQTLAPVGVPVELDGPVTVSLGPDNATAIALTGSIDLSGFVVGSVTDWALLDLESGEVLDSGSLGFEGRRVAISPDGTQAAIGGSAGDLVLLDLHSGEPIRPPVRIHEAFVLSVAYSTDGTQILTSAADSTAALWSSETGDLIAQVVTPHRYAAAAFGGDGETVLIAPEGPGSILTWNTHIDQAIRFACAVAGRDLTEAEWAELFPDRPYQPVCTS